MDNTVTKTKILYVEDNRLNKALVRRILETRGYDVVEADDGLSCVRVAQEQRPDLILMDIDMPGLDGYEASTMLKGVPGLEDVPIVAFTAISSREDRERMLAAGCDGYIPKTCPPEELFKQIEAYLQGKREKLTGPETAAKVRAYQQRLVERLENKIHELTRANEDLALLNNVAGAINSTLDLNELLKLITQLVEETLEVQACSVLLSDEQTGELVFKAVSGIGSDQLIGVRLAPGQGIAGWVAGEGQAVLTNDVRRDPRFFSGIDEKFEIQTRSIVCVPLRVKGEIIGVIEAVNKIEGQFPHEALRLLDSIGSTAALAIENARLYRDLQDERDHLIRKEEEVRRTIAHNLHDGPTQMLAAISMNVDFIKKLHRNAPEKVEEELDQLQRLADDTAHDVRTLLFGLHPIILETRGLTAALEVYVERFQDRRGPQLNLDLPPRLKTYLSQEAEIAAFIIVQEAINNARKHAEASAIRVTLRQTDTLFTIRVEDDGRGFNPGIISRDYDRRVSFGLSSMAERARLANAEFEVDSTPGQGTTVTLRFLLNGAAKTGSNGSTARRPGNLPPAKPDGKSTH
jgi:signal transduction histidine kinase